MINKLYKNNKINLATVMKINKILLKFNENILIYYIMNKELTNLFIFLALVFFAYLLFKNLSWIRLDRIGKEGMTDASGNNASSSNGIAGNAESYGATIKSETIKMQDILLISKYRSQYEAVILDLDDFVNNLMLTTALTIDKTKPEETLTKLNEMNQSKNALNNLMKFIDKSS
jgi:hypothetical protein